MEGSRKSYHGPPASTAVIILLRLKALTVFSVLYLLHVEPVQNVGVTARRAPGGFSEVWPLPTGPGKAQSVALASTSMHYWSQKQQGHRHDLCWIRRCADLVGSEDRKTLAFSVAKFFVLSTSIALFCLVPRKSTTGLHVADALRNFVETELLHAQKRQWNCSVTWCSRQQSRKKN